MMETGEKIGQRKNKHDKNARKEQISRKTWDSLVRSFLQYETMIDDETEQYSRMFCIFLNYALHN